MNYVQVALSGALLGGLYALMAAGVSVTWGVLRVINLAHFGLILVGAYLTFELVTVWQIDPIVTLAVTAPALFVVGAALQWAYDRLNITEFNSLLAWCDLDNTATLSGNALSQAVGNIGVNIAAGAGNAQHNGLSIAVASCGTCD